jgi:hypothetical protein
VCHLHRALSSSWLTLGGSPTGPVFGDSFVDSDTGKIDFHALDRAIELHELELARLKRLRNTQSMAHNLPAELLSRVFGSCLPLDWRRDLLSRKPLGLSDFVKLSHVCSRWHSIAVEDPNLWIIVPAANVKQTRVLLERARGVPLKVTLSDVESKQNKLVEDVILSGAPVQSMSIVYGEVVDDTSEMESLNDKLGAWFQRPAPELEKLTVRVWDDAAELPTNLFDGTAPKLRELDLNGVVFLPQYWSLFSGLRSLILVHLYGCLDIDVLLALQTMKTLEHLELRGPGAEAGAQAPNVPQFTPHKLSPVKMPFLTFVAITNPLTSTMVDLFTTYCITPRLVSLTLIYLGDSLGRVNSEDFFSSPVVHGFLRSHAGHLHIARVGLSYGYCEIKKFRRPIRLQR